MRADKIFIANQLLKLKKAFPQQPKEFFEILLERIEYYEFTERGLVDAVNDVIDTFGYKNLTIASIVKRKADETQKSAIGVGLNIIR